MIRTNGFIDLNQLLNINKTPELDKGLTAFYLKMKLTPGVNVVKYSGKNRQLILSFTYEGEKYYWKYDEDALAYNELVMGEIASDMKIPHLEYDLAKFGDYEGVISKNYKVEGAEYIPGSEILWNYVSMYPRDDVELSSEHNLETIWACLDYRYGALPNGADIVAKIMKKLAYVFVFDILTGQPDRHGNNWEIVEYENGDVDLQPIYDNSLALIGHPNYTEVFLKVDEETTSSLKENVTKFQRISSPEFSNLLEVYLWTISEENVLAIFERIEEKTGYPIPGHIKIGYLDGFSLYKTCIEKYLGLDEEQNLNI